MTDESTAGVARCPWCSAELPATDLANCPSCGATLQSEGEPQVPGVTAIDPEAVIRGARSGEPRPRSRLLSWITGEPVEEAGPPGSADSLAPPPPDVRREIMRLEMEAELANKSAEAESILAEERVEAAEGGRVPAEAEDASTEDASTEDAPTGEESQPPA